MVLSTTQHVCLENQGKDLAPVESNFVLDDPPPPSDDDDDDDDDDGDDHDEVEVEDAKDGDVKGEDEDEPPGEASGKFNFYLQIK